MDLLLSSDSISEYVTERPLSGYPIRVNTPCVYQIVDVVQHRRCNGVVTPPAAAGIGEQPAITTWRRQKCGFQTGLIIRVQHPRMFLPNDALVGWIKAAPHQRQIARLVVEEPYI